MIKRRSFLKLIAATAITPSLPSESFIQQIRRTGYIIYKGHKIILCRFRGRPHTIQAYLESGRYSIANLLDAEEFYNNRRIRQNILDSMVKSVQRRERQHIA